MVVLTIISALVMVAYLATMTALYGTGDYVSDYAYMGKYRWLFSATMVTSAITLLPVMMEKGGVAPFLALFAVFGLVLVGGEPLYKVEKMHTIGAFTALICGTLWVATFHPFIVSFTWLFWGAYVLLKLPKPYYLGEVIALALIYLTIII